LEALFSKWCDTAGYREGQALAAAKAYADDGCQGNVGGHESAAVWRRLHVQRYQHHHLHELLQIAFDGISAVKALLHALKLVSVIAFAAKGEQWNRKLA
jgi:hypothetical protein